MAAILLFILGVFIVAVLWVVLAKRNAKKEEESFKNRFPPISDAEFIARCTNGVDSMVALTVRRFVADHLTVEYSAPSFGTVISTVSVSELYFPSDQDQGRHPRLSSRDGRFRSSHPGLPSENPSIRLVRPVSLAGRIRKKIMKQRWLHRKAPGTA
jgi:hypothetical protein